MSQFTSDPLQPLFLFIHFVLLLFIEKKEEFMNIFSEREYTPVRRGMPGSLMEFSTFVMCVDWMKIDGEEHPIFSDSFPFYYLQFFTTEEEK